jgi:chorismate synthase
VLRYLTAGESHGQALTVTVEGLPAGLPVTKEQIQSELARRRLGFGRGPRQRFEVDDIELLGGIRHGRTLGSRGDVTRPRQDEEATHHATSGPCRFDGNAEVRV